MRLGSLDLLPGDPRGKRINKARYYRIPAGTMVLGNPVLGTRTILPALFERGVKLAANGVGGILDISVRVRIYKLLADGGFAFPALIHPRATIEPSARKAL